MGGAYEARGMFRPTLYTDAINRARERCDRAGVCLAGAVITRVDALLGELAQSTTVLAVPTPVVGTWNMKMKFTLNTSFYSTVPTATCKISTG